jgi:hypothetical protein
MTDADASRWNDKTLSWFDHRDRNVWDVTADCVNVEHRVLVTLEDEAVTDGPGRESVVLRN